MDPRIGGRVSGGGSFPGRRGLPAALATALTLAVFLLIPTPAEAKHDDCIALHDAAFLDEPDEVRQLLNRGVGVNCINPYGNTPLMTALEGASEDSIAILLDYGADVNALNEFGETPLQQAHQQLSRFNTQRPERYARLFMDVIENLQRAGALEKIKKPKATTAGPDEPRVQ